MTPFQEHAAGQSEVRGEEPQQTVLEDGRPVRRPPTLRLVYSGAPSGVRPPDASPEVPSSHVPQQSVAMLDRGLQARIGILLRCTFSDVADAPVPERFARLLEALQNKENSRDR